MWDFVILSLEISIQLFFFPFLFPGYCCSVDFYVTCTFFSAHDKCLLLFLMKSSSPCIDASTQSSMLTNPLPSYFLDTYILSMSPQGCKALRIVVSFNIHWYFCLSSSLFHFKKNPVQEGQPGCFSFSWDSCSFEDLKKKFFHICLFDGVTSSIPKYL